MRKILAYFFLPSYLFCWCLINGSFAFAEENIEYRFERLWPQLEQPWYFSHPIDIATAPDGSVYIVDSKNHRIQQFSAEGDFIQTWGREGLRDGQFNLPQGIAIAAGGSVYIADTDNHRIQQFSVKGDFIRAWGNEGSGDGQFSFPQGLAIASNSSVYIADAGNDRIQQFSANGDFVRTWGSSGSENGQFSFPSGLAIASDGSVYVADSSNRRIQQFSAEGAFIRTWGAYGEGDSQFHYPVSLTIASDGSVYVVDSQSDRIQQFTAKGDFIRKWGSEGTGKDEFDWPHGITIAADDSIHVVDTNNNRIQKFSATGTFIQTWGSYGFEDGRFFDPRGLALAPDGSVYIADAGNNRIQQFDNVGNFIRAWSSGDSPFNYLSNLAIAPDGSVYVADSDRIQQFSSTGDFIRTWGSYGSEAGQFEQPTGLAIAPNGSVYVADTFNHRIQQFSAKGDFIRTWGSEGSEKGQFNRPSGIAIAPDGNVYISDTNNYRIQKFSAEGDFILTWGSEGTGDGQFDRAEGAFGSGMPTPLGIAVALDGSVYIGDADNDRIQQFSATGEFIQTWGSYGSENGQFNIPIGLAIATNGSIYIADSGNHRIQKFVPRSKINIASPDPEGVDITHPYKAIILAGGGETFRNGRINHIWDGTWRISQKAYQALSRQAFVIHDEIKFLTAGSTQFDLDNNEQFDDLETASKDSLRRAITEWAVDAKDVVIYLSNHGGPDKFKVNAFETLTGEELNSWVSELEQRIPGRVTVIIEACNSASFFKHASKTGRFLFASAKADQAAVISNRGLTSFSYYFWSEVATGANVKSAFLDARQGMSHIKTGNGLQLSLAETSGNQSYDPEDLNILGDYCLGNCNKTQGAPPEIIPFSPSYLMLNGEPSKEFNVSVDHTQALDRVWALVQRPDDISIDQDQPLNFEKINLNCDSQGQCQGRYERFDIKGEYRLNVYALDREGEISFPETLTITQTQGKPVVPVQYDDQLAVVYLRDVLVNGQHLQVALELQGDKFVAIAVSEAPKQYTPAARFDFESGILNIPHALVFGKDYQATFKYLGNLEFKLESAMPR